MSIALGSLGLIFRDGSMWDGSADVLRSSKHQETGLFWGDLTPRGGGKSEAQGPDRPKYISELEVRDWQCHCCACRSNRPPPPDLCKIAVLVRLVGPAFLAHGLRPPTPAICTSH